MNTWIRKQLHKGERRYKRRKIAELREAWKYLEKGLNRGLARRKLISVTGSVYTHTYRSISSDTVDIRLSDGYEITGYESDSWSRGSYSKYRDALEDFICYVIEQEGFDKPYRWV